MRQSLFALVLLPALVAGTHALACQGKSVVFEDTFKDDLGGWEEDKNIKIGGGSMQVTLTQAANSNKELNTSFLVKDADICVEGTFPQDTTGSPGFGIMFWAVDYRNFYMFQVSMAGKAYLFRYATDRWVTIYSVDTPLVKKEAGATNMIRVTFKDQVISTYVNGTKVRDIRGQKPRDETAFGVYAEVTKEGVASASPVMTFKNFKVTSAD
jgi:hypothetical protein